MLDVGGVRRAALRPGEARGGGRGVDGVQRGGGVRDAARGPGLLARQHLARSVRLLPDQRVPGAGQHPEGITGGWGLTVIMINYILNINFIAQLSFSLQGTSRPVSLINTLLVFAVCHFHELTHLLLKQSIL